MRSLFVRRTARALLPSILAVTLTAVAGAEPAAAAPAGCFPVALVAAGGSHTIATRPDGTVWAWGGNWHGQVGDGTYTNRTTPVQLSGLTGVTALAAGESHSLALKSDGTVWAWGYTISATPAQVSGLTGVTAIAAGGYYALALKSDGSVWAWGANDYGQLGDGTTNATSTPVRVTGLTPFSAIAAGQYHSLAVGVDGSVWAWGANAFGQLGDGTTTDRHTPTLVPGLSTVTAVTAGRDHSVALKSDATLAAWGYNAYGQLGTGDGADSLTPVAVPGINGVTRVVAGGLHTLALRSGAVWSWGYGYWGQLGTGSTNSLQAPTQATGLTGLVGIAAGSVHSFAWASDGTVYGFGYDQSGQLGDGAAEFRPSPVTVAGVSGVSTAAVGTHALALRSDGTARAWGQGSYGKLGDGWTEDRPEPIQVVGLTGATAVAAGGYHSLALRSDGTVRAWGANWYGQLADGTTSSRPTPVWVSGLAGVTGIAAGTYHSLAVKSDGTVWAWGYNNYSQLGDGTTTQRTIPVQVTGLTGVVAVAAGDWHSLAVKSDGTVWAWGYNNAGQLGDGTTTIRSLPVQVSGLTGVTAVSGSSAHSMALKSDGTVRAWGNNSSAELGDGTTTQRTTPVQVSGLTGVTAIAAGSQYSVALKSDATMRTWGSNWSGQLGDGTYTNRTTPVQVPGLTGVAAVSTQGATTAAVLGDGTLRVWGHNAYGMVGNGTSNLRVEPVAIGCPVNTTTVIAPPAGSRFGVDATQRFTVRARTLSGTAYTATVTIRNGAGSVVRTFTTSSAASGAESSGTPSPVLPAGAYTWTAVATDSGGVTGPTTTSRSFAVAAARPTTPTVIAPTAGSRIAVASQTLTIRSTDADGDSYNGVVTVRNSGGTVVRTFSTSTAASGGNASVTVVPGLLAGSYTFTAVATDATGDVSSASSSSAFSVNNLPGVATLVSPSSGGTVPLDATQTFTISATDIDGDGYTGRVTIYDAATGNLVTTFSTPRAASGANSSASPPAALPSGAYTWTAYAVDDLGDAGWMSGPGSFSVPFRPGAPVHVSPIAGAKFGVGATQAFTVRATDTDGGTYTATVTVKDATTNAVVTTFTTASAASGADSSGSPATALPSGAYTWSATATDSSGLTGPTSAASPFAVAYRPGVPVLVAPAAAGRIAETNQTFTIRATDGDGDAYTGAVTVRDAVSGSVVATFSTASVASGANSSGSPVTSLAPGSYTWTAHAVDATGAVGTESAPAAFVVGRKPDAATLVSPADGAEIAAGAPQAFSVRVTDPDSVTYRGVVTIRNAADGSVVTTAQTAITAVGQAGTVTLTALLPAGSYTWSAHGLDDEGNTGPESGSRSFRVRLASEECTSGPVFDGYAGTAFLRSRVQTVDATTTWVCLRADAGAPLRTGGKLVLTGTTVNGTPSVDANVGACASTPGNTLPGPHPLYRGSVGDPSDPSTYTAYAFDAYVNDQAVWVCVSLTTPSGTTAQRILLPVVSAAVPGAVFLPDSVGPYPALRQANTAAASGACQAAATGTQHLNSLTTAGHVWADSWAESANILHVCVRVAGTVVDVGGRLTVDGTATGVTPTLQVSADTGRCGLGVASQGGAVSFSLRRSELSSPASLCLVVNGTPLVLTAGTPSGGGTPNVTWTPDPGSPV